MVMPSDESARARFASELDRNFSVVASAGSGKTTAITQRILSIARSRNAAEILPRLVVVTFTNRAADEMQQRARQILLQENRNPEAQVAFNRAFFGTIHAFCMKLLTDFGHYLGLPAPLELLEENDDADLWQQFVQSHSQVGHSLRKEDRTTLLRLIQARDLMELGRRAGSSVLRPNRLSVCPALDFDKIFAVPDKGNENIKLSQSELLEWKNRFTEGWQFLRWPIYFTSDNANFTRLWREKFSPFRKWIADAAMCVAAEVQQAYRDFRIERGLVTYADQVALARKLFQHPVAAQRIRENYFRVILDEAQDTEPAQFSVLVEAARPPTAAPGEWLESHVSGPPPGHFCMVGDFQQSIYSERADLKFYKSVHDALIAGGNGESLEFSVTFRLDKKQLKFINQTFRDILNAKEDQVGFVELKPRPEILPGRVIRVPLIGKDLLPEGKKLKDYQRARIEAEYLAGWINDAGLLKLCADSWRDVAILCPRKAWLQTMAAALRRAGLPVSIQSEREVKGDSPAYAWLTALLTIMTDPLNAYEIVGVLREIFGVSDHDLAIFSEGEKTRFRIDNVLSATGKVLSHLRILSEIHQAIDGLALFDAVTLIIDKTQLRERLLLLPATEFGDLARDLEALLAQAADAESKGMVLGEFAQHLRDEFMTPRAVRFAADDNAIQLITSHKAKGSEWQAVILPFLARELRPPSKPYPHFVKSPTTRELLIALGKEDKSKDLKDAIERAQRQEVERLLYVATTRAQRTLVIVLDQEIFATSDGELHKTAQLRRLIRNADTYSGQFDECTSKLEEFDDSESLTPPPAASEAKTDDAISRELKRATKRASEFIRKFTPSTLDIDVPVEIETTSRPNNLATLYGRWWHRFLERLDWKGGIDAAQKLFELQLPTSPMAESAKKHWSVTRKNLFSDATIAKFVACDNALFHHEFPFSWRRNDRSVVEGLIDALAIDRANGRSLLLDWKTNDISADDVESLRARYRPQLTAYWKAVSEITQLEVEAGLFSTALGRLLLYSPHELKAEWSRLEKLPPSDFSDEIRPDAPDDL